METWRKSARHYSTRPIVWVDYNGEWPQWVSKALTAVAIVAVTTVVVVGVVASAGALAPVVGAAASVYLGASAATAAAVSTAVVAGGCVVAAGVFACGVNRAIEAVADVNYGARILGEKNYNATEFLFNMAAYSIISAGAPYIFQSMGLASNNKAEGY